MPSLLGKALRRTRQRNFSAKASGLRCVVGNIFRTIDELPIPRKSQKGARKKIKSMRELLTLKAQRVFLLPASRADPKLHVSWLEPSPVWEKLPRQKHHDLARKLRVWHVMCTDIPISCRSGVHEAGMAHHMRYAPLVFPVSLVSMPASLCVCRPSIAPKWQ